MSNMRNYRTYYGIHINDYNVSFGGHFTDHAKLLMEEYISDGCSTEETSTATQDIEFLIPFHLAKTYFIEGTISGQITLASSSATATVTKYKVSVLKIHETSGLQTSLYDTGWVTVSDTLAWDGTYSIGEEMVYPFWIDAYDKSTITENERIFIKIEVDADVNTVFYHSNDSTWEDFKIEIPYMGL